MAKTLPWTALPQESKSKCHARPLVGPADRVDLFGDVSWEIHVRRFPKTVAALNHGFGVSPGDQYLDLGHPATDPTRNHDDFGS
jgi:hypothetical protein